MAKTDSKTEKKEVLELNPGKVKVKLVDIGHSITTETFKIRFQEVVETEDTDQIKKWVRKKKLQYV